MWLEARASFLMRKARIDREFKIVVDDQEISETSSEKLLGVVINNTLTWKNHLYGDDENDGLYHSYQKG